jgi:hypothetical protein
LFHSPSRHQRFQVATFITRSGFGRRLEAPPGLPSGNYRGYIPEIPSR